MIVLPSAQTPPLTGGPALRWGILGTGSIADAWATTVLAHTAQRIVAVGSAELARAAAFASRHAVRIASGVVSTGLNTTRTGIEPAASSPSAISSECEATFLSVSSP